MAEATLRRRLLVVLVVLVVGGVTAAIAAVRLGDPPAAIEASGPMPLIDRPSMNGMGRVERSLYEGKVVLVNFWAAWCAPCREEQPVLSRLWEEYRDRGVQFIGIDAMDVTRDGLDYLEEFDVAYPSVEDPASELMGRFGIPYLPATILVGADGEMRVRLVGAQDEATLREHIDELLAEADA